ncbi:CsbD family protein [Rubellimicrobium sp. CFH 75288]|uniref:CsbD family protein n=1 Tax=Rubellimicrobium sp. CFH 75288 TaxID=2697034 RepID=UPI00141317F4|nr:CsbD family protein [Rubellimicrobium sp. CFH 75288]NAZ37480.1 CsbD family protein [Rubellimicrobium sp. CFH 75288]
MANESHAKGTASDLGGKLKEGVGKLTGDKSLEAEGHMDQAKGSAQKAWGDVKDALAGKK